jgi:glutathione synthase/RimK-type ligase-like ATP-grasp enzyme
VNLVKSVGVVTGLQMPEPDTDEPLLLAALEAAGMRARAVAWDDPTVPWGEIDLCVVRSTWNYIGRRDAFLAWSEACARATDLVNPPSVLRWSTDKAYLAELERRGVAIVPTAFVEQAGVTSASAIAEAHGWSTVVVKPRVSAGSHATRKFTRAAWTDADAFLAEHVALGPMMIQPYQRAVEGEGGERSLVWIAGEWTHAVRKAPRFDGDTESVSGPLPIADDERELADRAIAPFARDVLYGRADVVRDDEGRPRLMELELAEPSLFLDRSSRALERLVSAIARRAR